MPLDGLYMHFIKREIEQKAVGSRVEKIAQPGREELVLHLRGKSGSQKLLLSGGAQSPRLHFVERAPENPATPPMFCMLLRKRLGGGWLTGVRQIGLDRTLHLDFTATNELGDKSGICIAVEVMGRHSNVIVMDGDGKILDALRRVDIGTSRVRQVLPGMRYALPPGQQKLNLLESQPDDIVEKLRAGQGIPMDKAISELLQGFSALAGREAAFYATRGADVTVDMMTDEQGRRLGFYLREVKAALTSGIPAPVIISEKQGRPRDFSCLPTRQYGSALITKDYPGCSVLLEHFFAERDRVERIRQRSGDLLTLLVNTSDRVARKVALQKEELENCRGRETLRQMGDLVNSNLYTISKGDTKAVVQNFYHPQGENIEIELDPLLTPAQNAQRYYTLYRKADTAEKHLTKLIAAGEQEIIYLDSVFDALSRANGGAELDAIRGELAAGGYVRRAGGGGKTREQRLPALRYRSSEGFVILCGRNNLQNDLLTLKEAAKTDLWLHTKNIPGSHVIVVSGGQVIPEQTILEAAMIAAHNSKGREGTKIAVDFCPVKNVKKPGGAKPGMVIYEGYRTILVDPDKAVVSNLSKEDKA